MINKCCWALYRCDGSIGFVCTSNVNTKKKKKKKKKKTIILIVKFYYLKSSNWVNSVVVVCIGLGKV